MPIQARINDELSIRLNDGVLAGIVSFLGSALLMGAAVLWMASGRTALRFPRCRDAGPKDSLITATQPA
jgi:uncharacterized membrane protein YdcZ (DUF606 family)